MMENNKVFAMKFSKIYPLLVLKTEKKGRTKKEVDEIICLNISKMKSNSNE